MSQPFIWIVVAVALVLLWIRDECKRKHTPPVSCGDGPECLGRWPTPSTMQEANELLKACGIEGKPPTLAECKEALGAFDPFKDYSKDEEFCRENPCDYMEPYRKPDGSLTYLCANRGLWKRLGVEAEILQNLNDGGMEQCARSAGLPCKGGRK